MPGLTAMMSGRNATDALPRRLHFVDAKRTRQQFKSNVNVSRKHPVPNREEQKDDSLTDRSNIKLEWQRPFAAASGLSNMGNTCFLNSVLQCLTHTPPLVNFLMSGSHSSKCRSSRFCLVCWLSQHTKRALVEPIRVIKPKNLLANLRLIGKRFRVGRQEDAHEFLRKMHETMYRHEGGDSTSQIAGTPGALFGGRFRSQVRCLSCGHNSDSFDPFLDVSLDLPAKSVNEAFHRFTRPEKLVAPNLYRCGNCKTMSEARKQLLIADAPPVLTVQLKRFTPFGDKIGQPVPFEETLDLSPFMVKSAAKTQRRYRLFGLVCHYGGTVNSGHYVAYVRGAAGPWFCMNDERVQRVSLSSVLQQRPYLLFYVREESKVVSRPSVQEAPSRPLLSPMTVSPKDDIPQKNPLPAFNPKHPSSHGVRVMAPRTVPVIPVNSGPSPTVSFVAAARGKNAAAAVDTPSSSLSSSCASSGSSDDSDSSEESVRLTQKRIRLRRDHFYPAARARRRGHVRVYVTAALSSLRAPEVSTWTPETSQDFVRESNAIISAPKGRSDYDEEYDRGRVKKVRRNTVANAIYPDHNVFQAAFKKRKQNFTH